MEQHQHLGAVGSAERNTPEVADAKLDRHPHAVDGTPKHDAFTVKFDTAHAVVGTNVLRLEAHG